MLRSVQTELLIQAQLTRESGELSPALLRDLRRMLELAPRLLEELMKVITLCCGKLDAVLFLKFCLAYIEVLLKSSHLVFYCCLSFVLFRTWVDEYV